ncbi:hypothetical protein [Roseiconus lacunae]|uniref:hypothetical protein n=1 Tax=Roseiconus lacunae TaxID=2605694 RepID=UPI001E3E1F33|nr:hypothetical protein [Roseiconus lacunae]
MTTRLRWNCRVGRGPSTSLLVRYFRQTSNERVGAGLGLPSLEKSGVCVSASFQSYSAVETVAHVKRLFEDGVFVDSNVRKLTDKRSH